MNEKELARATAIAPTTIYRHVGVRGRPDSDMAIKIAREFGADQDDVLGLAGHRVQSGRRAPDDPRREVVAKLEGFLLTPARQRLLLGIFEYFREEDRAIARERGRREQPQSE